MTGPRDRGTERLSNLILEGGRGQRYDRRLVSVASESAGFRRSLDRSMLNPIVKGWQGLGTVRDPFWRGFCRGWLLAQPAWLLFFGWCFARWVGWL